MPQPDKSPSQEDMQPDIPNSTQSVLKLEKNTTLINPLNPDNKFEKFPKLPAELRLMVWENVAHHPRFIKIFSGMKQDVGQVYKLVMTAPVSLRINKESRKVTVKFFEQIPKTGTSPISGSAATAPVYINWATDSFHVQFQWLFMRKVVKSYSYGLAAFTCFKNMENICIDSSCWLGQDPPFDHLLRWFPAIKEITLVIFNSSFDHRLLFSHPLRVHVIPLTAGDAAIHKGFCNREKRWVRWNIKDADNCVSFIVEQFAKRKRDFPDSKVPVLKFGIIRSIDADEAMKVSG